MRCAGLDLMKDPAHKAMTSHRGVRSRGSLKRLERLRLDGRNHLGRLDAVAIDVESHRCDPVRLQRRNLPKRSHSILAMCQVGEEFGSTNRHPCGTDGADLCWEGADHFDRWRTGQALVLC